MSLLSNISQLRRASTINVGNTLAAWQPYIDEAEETFVRPVIGDALFEELEKKLQASASVQSAFDGLGEKLRRAIALYALYLGIDEMAVSVSAQGVQVIESESHRAAPQYKLLNLKETWLARAHRHIDLALKFIGENPLDFPLYQAQDGDLFIRSAEQFQAVVDIRSSRRVFLALKPVIRSMEKKYIRPTISEGLFDLLKEQLQAVGLKGLPGDSAAVVDLIVPALAHLSMARALQEISVDTLDWGIFSTAANTYDNVRGKQAANRERIAAMIEACQRDGEAELKALEEFLDASASESLYPLYFRSSRYHGPAATSATRGEFANTADNSFFIA